MIELDSSRRLAADIGIALAGRDISFVEDMLSNSNIDWAYLLYFCDVHGLFGLLHTSISGIDDARIPLRAAAMITREVDRQNKRWNALSEMLVTLMDAVKNNTEVPILLKGAALKLTVYKDSPEQRQIGDVDILVSSEDAESYCSVLKQHGYLLRQGKNGYTAINNNTLAGRLVVDVHVDDTSKMNRNPKAVYHAFKETSLDPTNDSWGYRQPSFEMTFLHGCKHFCEHMDDFRKVLVQDDIRLFRLTDLILLIPHVNRSRALTLAKKLGWENELARAIGYLRGIKEITEGWPYLYPEFDSIDTPFGVKNWPWSFNERIRRLDQDQWMARELGPTGARSNWYTGSQGAKTPECEM
ncbi:TPA: nucleotidyltransferase family protein [Acinetobacter baumannii]|nr:nucleotidyltransferase family protein [Acinetobacter baumannii]MDC5547694.1 nucleotidyltransferase family protein [Acinetobacter baumannii]MDX7929021.1 nucleotidyltransferase family protein [Acinetobacter baumannii]